MYNEMYLIQCKERGRWITVSMATSEKAACYRADMFKEEKKQVRILSYEFAGLLEGDEE